jgi:hypothetical protein
MRLEPDPGNEITGAPVIAKRGWLRRAECAAVLRGFVPAAARPVWRSGSVLAHLTIRGSAGRQAHRFRIVQLHARCTR